MRKGFTLIELLIVIAIVGILSTIVLVGLNQSKVKTRDSARKVLSNQIASSLEYYFTLTGTYPTLQPYPVDVSNLNAVLYPTYTTENIAYDNTNVSGATYYSSATSRYVLYFPFENPVQTTPSVQYGCKTGVGTDVTNYYPGIPICNR